MLPNSLSQHRQAHLWKTIGYLATMVVLTGALGYLFLGVYGLIWGMGMLLFAGFMSQQIPLEWIMQMHRGRPIRYDELPGLFELVKVLSYQAELSEPPKLYLLPGNAINAFAAGSSSQYGIALSKSCLELLNTRELAGILAHEISHIRSGDLILGRLVLLINRTMRLFAFIGQLMLLFSLPMFFIGEIPIPWLGILLLLFAPFVNLVLQLAISRTREFEADLEAANITGDPTGLADALERVHWHNRGAWRQLFSREKKQRKLPEWLSTHPNMKQRIKRLRQLAQ